jgi:ABC-type Mn2+/Zn2+ transport system permease subunit
MEKKVLIRLGISDDLAFAIWFALFFGLGVVLVIWGR